MSTTGIACCMYKDKLYVLESQHSDSWTLDAIMTNTVLYIIGTLNYTIETVTNFATKTSGIDSSWTVPADSSSNINLFPIQSVSYSSLLGFGDKIYFIPYAQKDVGVFDLKTRTFDQTTFNLCYNGGFYGSVYNPSNKYLYMNRAYKVSSSAGWNIPYLDFTTTTPTLGSVTLPSNYVGFRGGTYCHTNGSVYIPMGVVDNCANAYVLKITSANTASALTFNGSIES